MSNPNPFQKSSGHSIFSDFPIQPLVKSNSYPLSNLLYLTELKIILSQSPRYFRLSNVDGYSPSWSLYNSISDIAVLKCWSPNFWFAYSWKPSGKQPDTIKVIENIKISLITFVITLYF